MEKLEVIQRALIRSVLRLPQCTAVEALYLLTGLMPVKTYILRAKINYYKYVSSLNDERWVYQAFEEQLHWLEYDNLLERDITGRLCLTPHHTYKLNTYWMSEVAFWYNTLGYPALTHLSNLSVRLGMIRVTWDFILLGLKESLRDGTPNPLYKVSLRYVDDNPTESDWGYHRHKHVWWLRAKLDSIFLNAKKKPGRTQKQGLETLKLCPVCGKKEETLDHFLCECDPYPPFPIRFRIMNLTWWFSCYRTDADRSKLSTLIGHRWSIRERQILTQAGGPAMVEEEGEIQGQEENQEEEENEDGKRQKALEDGERGEAVEEIQVT